MTVLCKSADGNADDSIKAMIDALIINSLMFSTGLLLAKPLSNVIGRRRTLLLQFILSAGSMIALFFCRLTPIQALTNSLIFTCSNTATSVLTLFILEVYPTTFRATALLTIRSGRKFGQLMAQLLPMMLTADLRIDVVVTLLTLPILSCVLTLLLPRDTNKQPVKDF